MTEFTSETKTLPYSQEKVYESLSNLEYFEKIKEQISSDKISDITFERDSFSCSVNPVGKVKFAITEREPSKTIQMQVEQSPIDIRLWIRLAASDENETKMKLSLKADLNPFIKPMLSKPLQEGVDKIAQMLATIPYNGWERTY
jgi:carbon monoxide dehydrogenase subunit G